jgi:hypothetical protein
MKVEINGKEYDYFNSIVELSQIRNNFMELINETFCFDFREWYKKGYWTKKYEPHVRLVAYLQDQNIVIRD